MCVVIGLPFFARPAAAAELQNRSVTVSSAVPSATATDDFSFTYVTAGTVGSLVFEYCDNSPLFDQPCDAPAGFDVTGATLSGQTGVTDYSVNGGLTTANKLVLSRGTLSAITPVASTYSIDNIVNPSDGGHTIFVRISDYATNDASGAYTDSGAVAFATITPFNVGAAVPPYLRLCAAVTVAPDCSSENGDTIELGTFSSAHVTAAQSQFSTGTNSLTGYIVFALGSTMTSGNNTIASSSSPTANSPGRAQFGINLRANTNPVIGQEPLGNGSGTPAAGYDTPNLFTYNPGDAVASSSAASDYNRMTASYVINIPPDQPLGVYSTTITYLATADF